MTKIVNFVPKPLRRIAGRGLHSRHLVKLWYRSLRPYKTKQQIHEYWRSPADAKCNRPEVYLIREVRSRYFVKIASDYATPDMSFLEIGCNVGRNLYFLWQAGYKNLSGIEISPRAIESMKQAYPDMQIKVYNNSVEEIIKQFKDNEFDVVFTMAVLEHIHKDSIWIFPEIARITKRTLILIEDEHSLTERHFPRNYGKIFNRLGMKEIKMVDCSKVDELSGDALYTQRYVTRIFQKM